MQTLSYMIKSNQQPVVTTIGSTRTGAQLRKLGVSLQKASGACFRLSSLMLLSESFPLQIWRADDVYVYPLSPLLMRTMVNGQNKHTNPFLGAGSQ